MPTTKQNYAGIKQLSKEYAITIPKARNALMAGKIMTADGKPVNDTFAIAQTGENDEIWYRWDRKVAFRAFGKAGHKKPTPLESYSHVQSRYQAQKKLNDAFEKMGAISKLESAYQDDQKRFCTAYQTYTGSMHCGSDLYGGSFAVLHLATTDDCVRYLNNLRRGIDCYEQTCKSICTTTKQIAEVEFYAAAIRRVADWIQLQFFR